MIQIEIPNVPKAWAPPRIFGRFHHDPRAKEKSFTRWQIRKLYRGDPIEGYVALNFIFHMPVPNSTSQKKRVKMLSGEIYPTNCDVSNLTKLYEDCLKKIVITDDRNVIRISSEKKYAEKEGIFIQVYPLKEYLDRVATCKCF